jgi:hypothetical protein
MKVYNWFKENGPSRMARGTLVQDKNGHNVYGEDALNDERGYSYCLYGIVCKLYSLPLQGSTNKHSPYPLNKISAMTGPLIGDWADRHAFEEILTLCKELEI